MSWDLESARQEVSHSSAGGAPFLICFGATILACAVLAFYLPPKQAALAVLFQGGIALPAAFLLERRMAWGPMAKTNPMNALSVQLAMSQILAFPVVIAMFDLRPAAVPLAMASIAGGHFLPYAWLQRTNVYVGLAVAVSLGALVLQIWLGSRAFPYILMHMTACYWIGAVLVYRAARALAPPSPPVPPGPHSRRLRA
jgi:hypothetical protein